MFQKTLRTSKLYVIRIIHRVVYSHFIPPNNNNNNNKETTIKCPSKQNEQKNYNINTNPLRVTLFCVPKKKYIYCIFHSIIYLVAFFVFNFFFFCLIKNKQC